jgi:hypothetical protein
MMTPEILCYARRALRNIASWSQIFDSPFPSVPIVLPLF